MSYSLAFSQAIVILMHIAIKMEICTCQPKEFISTKSISQLLNIPIPTTVKILKNLNASGIIITKEGSKGGILLTKPSCEITLLDIFLAIEGEKSLFKTSFDFNVNGEKIEIFKKRVELSLSDAEISMKNSLKDMNLSELIK